MDDCSRIQQLVFVETYRAMKLGSRSLREAKKQAKLPEHDPARVAAMSELARRQVHSYAFKTLSEALGCPACEPVEDLEKVHLQWSLPESVQNTIHCVD